MDKDYKVRKHNYLVNAKAKKIFSVNELKLVAKTISLLTPKDTNLKTKTIHIKNLDFIGQNDKNHTYFKNLFEGLLSKPFQIPNGKGWVNWFSYLNYENGFIEYAFDERLKNYLLEVKGNSKDYYLSNVLNLNSAYSIRVYELLNQMRDKGGRTIFIDEFKELLNIPDSYNIDKVKKRILDKAKEDLEKNSDIKFEYSFEKQGAKFIKINFKINASKFSISQIKKGENNE